MLAKQRLTDLRKGVVDVAFMLTLLAGLGIGALPRFAVANELRAGRGKR